MEGAMSKIEKFLQELEKEDQTQYFILYKFYKMPESSLGGSEESTIEEYQKFGSITQLVLNNTFFQFLKLCLEDSKFCQKLNYNLLRKLRFVLFDSKTFQENYVPQLEDPYLKKWCQNKVPIGPVYSKKYNVLQLMKLFEQYRQYGWIYDLGLDRQQIKDLDISLVEEVLYQTGSLLDIYYETYILPEENKKRILERIKNDNYNDPESCFLTSRKGTELEIFKLLVCDNDFLQIVEEELLARELPIPVKENVLEILELSIDFKTMNSAYEDFYIHYQELGDKVKDYDYKKAIQLFMKLQERPLPKIVQFSHFQFVKK